MSVRLSKLKASKNLVYNFLHDKYPNEEFVLFYSIGQQESDYDNQYLKIETSLPKHKWNNLLHEIQTHLIKIDEHYIGLRFRITELRR